MQERRPGSGVMDQPVRSPVRSAGAETVGKRQNLYTFKYPKFPQQDGLLANNSRESFPSLN